MLRRSLPTTRGDPSKYLYSRNSNPTIVSVERQIAALDSAERALVFSSGMGATTTILMAYLRAGDEVVCSAAIYGTTLHFLSDFLTRFKVTARFVSLDKRLPSFWSRTSGSAECSIRGSHRIRITSLPDGK